MSCKVCEKKFSTAPDLMHHKQINHEGNIRQCRYFLQGTCDKDSSTCWFSHKQESTDIEQMEIDNNQVFHEAAQKIPPDQMNKMLGMLNKLSFQVDQLEKMSQMTQRVS